MASVIRHSPNRNNVACVAHKEDGKFHIIRPTTDQEFELDIDASTGHRYTLRLTSAEAIDLARNVKDWFGKSVILGDDFDRVGEEDPPLGSRFPAWMGKADAEEAILRECERRGVIYTPPVSR